MTPEGDVRLTVDDVRHHAEEVRDLALSEARRLADEQATRAFIVGAVVVVGLISVAYYLGSRSGGRARH